MLIYGFSWDFQAPSLVAFVGYRNPCGARGGEAPLTAGRPGATKHNGNSMMKIQISPVIRGRDPNPKECRIFLIVLEILPPKNDRFSKSTSNSDALKARGWTWQVEFQEGPKISHYTPPHTHKPQDCE